MTIKELEDEISSLRTKERFYDFLIYGCGVGTFIMIQMKNYLIEVIFIVIAFICAIRSNEAGKALKKMLSDIITNSVIKEVLGDDVEYSPWGKIEPGSMVFPFSYNSKDGSDYIKTVYNGLNIELGDIELIIKEEFVNENDQTETRSDTVFKGQWLTCDFGKELAGQVYISEWTKKDRRSMKGNVTMDNEQFSKRFCINADNPQEAYYILTPHMMEYITFMADKSGGTVYMSFLRDGKMHVAVNTGRDFFELGKSNANVGELRQKFLGELRWFTDIVDTLRVEDTLYKKEINT